MPFDNQNYGSLALLAESCNSDLPAPVDPMLRLLESARRHLESNWCQVRGRGDVIGDEPRCLSNTLGDISGDMGGPLHQRTLDYIATLLPEQTGDTCSAVFNFNDSATHAEVLAFVDRAIASRKVVANA